MTDAPTVGRMMAGVDLPREPQEDLGRRTAYEDLCQGKHLDGQRGRVVMCVYTTDLDEGRGDLYVAAGLGLALVERGYGVHLVPRQRWHEIEHADVFVAMLPDVDPSFAPADAWKVAWVRNETERWTRSSHLMAFDQVIASSQLALTRLASATPRALGVVPIGVDTELFRPAPAGAPRSRTAVTTANFWLAPREVHHALMQLPDDADVAMYGHAGKAPEKLLRWHRSAVPYFAIPEIYRRSAIVIDDLNSSTVGFGTLNSRFFESAACGSLPLMNGLLGVEELGLPGVPRYTDPDSLAERLDELRRDPDGVAAQATQLQQMVRTEHSWQRRADQFVDALDQGRRSQTGPAPSKALHVFPDYSAANPYQKMLNARLGDVDAYAVPVRQLLPHLTTRTQRPGDPGVLNLHWTSPILQPADGPFRARLRLTQYTRLLDAFIARGGRLVWTVHNVLPHDVRYRRSEIELARVLADRADVIHVLTEATLDEVRDVYDLDPAKVVVVEHSSYVGQYPQTITRADARARLGVSPDDKVMVALGGIRPYKGLEALIDVLDELVLDDPTVRLLIAGQASKDPAVEQLRERCETHPRVTASFKHVLDDEVQVWMTAADLAVLAHRQVLNSGAFMLAQTFGLPVVAPRAGSLRAWGEHPHVRLYDPADPADLLSTVRAALDDFVRDVGRAQVVRQESLAAAEARTPDAMGSAFATAVAPLLHPR